MQQLHLVVNEQSISVTLKENRRAKALILRVNPADKAIILVKPKRIAMKYVIQFLEEKKHWIIERIKQLPEQHYFTDGAIFPFLGEHCIIEHRVGRYVMVKEGDKLYVSGELEHANRRIKDFLKREAKRLLQEKVKHYAAQLGVTIRSVTVRDTQTRWGSCSASGNLSFCWRLILAPEAAMDYVVAHEVAHMKEMNHSKAFWDIVAALYPDYKKQRQWLKKHGESLYHWG